MRGFTGKVLFVDLTSGAWHEETVPDEVYERYLGGVGLGAHILTERIPPGADPLGPDNMLGFLAGVLVGTGTMFAGRWMVVGKSPLTGGWGDSNCGGNLAPAIKQCGYDGIFISGKASQPVTLLVKDGSVEIRPAGHLWGRDAVETELALQQELGEKVRAAAIGPAGEKLSLIAGIVNDRGRLAARSGLGAVMGSKNLKAVALLGTQKVDTVHPEELARIAKEVGALMPKGGPPMKSWMFPLIGRFMGASRSGFRVDGLMSLPVMRRWGTISGTELGIITGDTPVRNWRGHPGQYRTGSIGADRMIRDQKKNYACSACPLGCGAIVNGPAPYPESHRPEYETATGFGPLLLIQDTDAIFYLNEYINRAGLDVISTAGVAAFAFDCFEHGLITEQDTGGLRLEWGSAKAAIRLVEMIARREGIGDLLADGAARAVKRLGPESEKFAFHAGGQELPMHDPRIDTGYGFFYASDPTPGRHTTGSNIEYEVSRAWVRVGWAPKIPATYAKSAQYQASRENAMRYAAAAMLKMVVDGAGFCTFGVHLGADRLGMFEALNAATGWEKTPEEYMEMGRRVQTLRQQFNVRERLEPASVELNPLVYGKETVSRGPQKGKSYDVYALRSLFWEIMGWDPQTGHPKEAA